MTTFLPLVHPTPAGFEPVQSGASDALGGSAVGAGAAAGAVRAALAEDGIMIGAGTASAAASAALAALGSGQGVGSAAAAIQAVLSAAGTTAGIGTASAVVLALLALTGAAPGVGTASGAPTDTLRGVGAAAGLGAASGASTGSLGEAGAAAGVGTASGAPTDVLSEAGAAAGVGAATGAETFFANPQVLLITSDSQGKSTISTAEQNAAVAAYTANPKIKIMNASGAFVQYTPGTLTGLDFGAVHGIVGPELEFIAKFVARYPNDNLYIIKENVSGGCQTRGLVTGTATCSGSGNSLTVNAGTVVGNELLVGTGIDPGIYCPFGGFLSKVGVAGGATATAFSNVSTTRYNGAASWSSTEGLAYNGNSAAINNGARARMVTALASLTSPKISCHIHCLGTNDATQTALGASYATDQTAFLNRLPTDLSTPYTGAKICLVRPMASGTAQAAVRTAIANEATSRTNAMMINMDAQTLWDGTHWAIAGVNYMADQAFAAAYP